MSVMVEMHCVCEDHGCILFVFFSKCPVSNDPNNPIGGFWSCMADIAIKYE